MRPVRAVCNVSSLTWVSIWPVTLSSRSCFLLLLVVLLFSQRVLSLLTDFLVALLLTSQNFVPFFFLLSLLFL